MGGANIHTRSVWGWRRTRKINGVKKIKKAETHSLGGKTITGSKIDSEKKKKEETMTLNTRAAAIQSTGRAGAQKKVYGSACDRQSRGPTTKADS